MKKILLMIILCMTLLSSCNKQQNDTGVTKVTNYLSSLSSYSLSSTMTINRPDKKISMNVCVDYLSPSYYKVIFGANQEQIIIKNDEGVFVLTPSLNKEFKFDSQWPLNGSHAYLLEAINKDLKADSEIIESSENGIITLECKIQHKTNKKATKMKYICGNDFKPIKTVFMNDSNEEIIIVDFDSFQPNTNLGKDHFNEKKYLNKEILNKDEETSFTIEAGYVLEGSSLISSSYDDETAVLCYSGDVNYTIVMNKAIVYSEIVVIENYDDFEVLECGLCLFKENSMRYYLKGYEISIYSLDLEYEDYLNIAESITLV